MTDVREKLVELIDQARVVNTEYGVCISGTRHIADHLISNGVTVQECPRPFEEWNEDYGDVLWWKFPIEEPPYVGSPFDEKWPAYHTHWTPIALPQPPKGE